MIVYPDDNYDSWISEDDADTYFEGRLNVDEWLGAEQPEAALMTAFRSLNELSLDLSDLEEDEDLLTALKQAQCEQALHELKHDLSTAKVQGVSLGGLLSVKFSGDQRPPRYSDRALAILRPYVTGRTVTRTR